MDRIFYEYNHYGVSYLFFCLARLFTLIINNCISSQCSCLYHNKSRLNPDLYRSIMLLSVIFKIFESVLDSLMPQLEETEVHPNSHQCGFQRGLSSPDTSFAFVDSSKAFDTVWHTWVFFKLSQIGICPKVWMTLDQIINNAKSCILVNSVYSRTFRQIRGLCQGSMLAPILYVLYINELLKKLTSMKKGSSILDAHISFPTQADDIALLKK